MNNREIAQYFGLLADLMELHNENPFKIKSYAFAARNLKNIDVPLKDLSIEELENIQGVGKTIGAKIFHLTHSGKFELLEKYAAMTPPGIIELLQLKGIGPKKIAQLWKELEIESIGELEYACNENRLVELKGFGKKTQENILQQLQFFSSNANKFLWVSLEELANEIIAEIQTEYPGINVSTCGEFRRKGIVLQTVDFLISSDDQKIKTDVEEKYKGHPVQFHFCKPSEFYLKLLELSGDKEHFGFLSYKIDASKNYSSEKEIYEAAGFPFIPPELRDNKIEWKLAEENKLPELIDIADIKGIVHAHSNYSDGAPTLKQLATFCNEQGFEYLVISDHSRSAFYANGLSVQRILEQHDEIDQLNKQLAPFHIFKSIECDILPDGSLDYEDEILKKLDLVIASVHSQLKMSEEKAMKRLLKAIEHPYTTILGHMTGRLLLSRPGYPVDHKKIIDACAANNVCIEVNANPRRLDIDYSWIPYCMEKDAMISINPDAHSLRGVHDIKYGVYAARKGGLLKDNTLNTLTKDNFEKHIKTKNGH
jgi:DNA polymerase (family 10)